MNALLVIDVQQMLMTGAYKEDEVLGAINTSITSMREHGGLVVFIQHCHNTFEPLMRGKPSWALHALLDVQDGDLRIEKEASDAFYETNLHNTLQAAGVEHIYATGLQTEFCVDATCRAALSHGYAVTLISDAHTTGDATLKASEIIQHHNYTLSNLAHPSRQISLCTSAELANQVKG